jgi:subtilase family serine protease
MLLFCLLVLSICHGLPAPLSRSWRLVEGTAISGSEPLSVYLFLQSRTSSDVLERELLERSTPHTAKYASWLSKEQVEQLMNPSTHVANLVSRYLVQHGVHGCDKVMNMWRCDSDVATLSSLLNTTFGTYKHVSSTNAPALIRVSTTYTIPDELKSSVLHVGGIAHLPHVRRQRVPKPLLRKQRFALAVTPHFIHEVRCVLLVRVQGCLTLLD